MLNFEFSRGDVSLIRCAKALSACGLFGVEAMTGGDRMYDRMLWGRRTLDPNAVRATLKLAAQNTFVACTSWLAHLVQYPLLKMHQQAR